MSRHTCVTNRYRTGIKWEVVRTPDGEHFEAAVDENTFLRIENVQEEWVASQYDKDENGDFDMNPSWTECFQHLIEAFNFAELGE